MEKIVIAVVLVIALLSACEDDTQKIHREQTTLDYGFGGNAKVEQYHFNRCDYIGSLHGTNTDWCTHKGDCSNPIHKQHTTDTIFVNTVKVIYLPSITSKKLK